MGMQFPVVVILLGLIAFIWNRQKENKIMKKIVDKSILLMVGTSLLGRPVSGVVPTPKES